MRKPSNEKSETNKGAWSKEEDQKLIDYIHTHGQGRWQAIPQSAGLLRCGKSCRLRWVNYLRPDLKKGNFGEDEEELIIKLHALLGNRWSLIAGRLPGRTDNEVKNYWNTHLRKKLIKIGLDPNKHRIGQLLYGQYCHKVTKLIRCDKLSDQRTCSSIVEVMPDSIIDCRSESGSANCLPDLNLDPTIQFGFN